MPTSETIPSIKSEEQAQNSDQAKIRDHKHTDKSEMQDVQSDYAHNSNKQEEFKLPGSESLGDKENLGLAHQSRSRINNSVRRRLDIVSENCNKNVVRVPSPHKDIDIDPEPEKIGHVQVKPSNAT